MRVILLLGFVSMVFAATWTGLGPNNLWDNGGNWDSFTVPTEDDDCVIPKGFDVLVGTANGASCKTLLIADSLLTVNGASVKVQGNLTLGHAARVVLNPGGGLVSFGWANINNEASMTVNSGRVEGNILVSHTGLLRFDGLMGAAIKLNGDVVNLGMLELANTDFSSEGDIWDAGFIRVLNRTRLQLFTVLEQSGDAAEINGEVEVTQFAVPRLNVVGGKLTVAPGGLVDIDDLKVAGAAELTVIAPSEARLEDVTTAGPFFVKGSSARVYFDGDVSIATLVSSGKIRFEAVRPKAEMKGKRKQDPDVAIGELTLKNAVVESDRILSVDSLITQATSLISGEGALVVNKKALLGGQPIFGGKVLLEGPVMSDANQVTVDSTMAVSGSLELNAPISNWGPADSTKPGTLINQLALTVKGNTTFIALQYNGFGDINLAAGSQFNLQSMNVTAGTLSFQSDDAVLTGANMGLRFMSLVGPSNSSRFRITRDGRTTTCVSPCPSWGNGWIIQDLRITVAAA
eukprot:NODE_490_length_1611_cov_6.343150_g373_i0.p1 GENE.NODE_490_length_1611_cov_6.343150_g373_i0~~NODE_490_length_1611_cov_6.343150_g373_i0.p1  ORF type:complete len:517 (+),score=115.48 NODE_490_length_1611_cov_6.343150_g373_i0:54-1604(+)